jgi:hypothetical protein
MGVPLGQPGQKSNPGTPPAPAATNVAVGNPIGGSSWVGHSPNCSQLRSLGAGDANASQAPSTHAKPNRQAAALPLGRVTEAIRILGTSLSARCAHWRGHTLRAWLSHVDEIYGPRRTFASRAAADHFLRHATRELTAGGLAHWVEAREHAPGRWLAIVHRSACAGGERCSCGSPADER